MEGWNEIRAAYRLFAEEDVTHSALIKPHTVATRDLAQNSPANVVLFIQDTSELDYTQHRSVKGLGHIGDGKGRGMMLHSCLAVIPIPGNPQVLGLAGQIPWMRSNENHDLNTEIVPELLRTQSEGEIWAEIVEFIGKAPAPETLDRDCAERTAPWAIARLGGFIGRKSDGSPGWQTLWRGWNRLQDMCWGANFASSDV
jgi:hypothetical protein